MIVRIFLISVLSCVFSLLNAQEVIIDSVVSSVARPSLAEMVEQSPLLQTGEAAIEIYDLTADTLIFARNEQMNLRPASTMKLLTAITALDTLGVDYQYKTRLCYTGEIDHSSSVLKGNLYIIGGMDPTITESDLNAFVDTIKSKGISTIQGNLYADRTMKDRLLYGEGWCWDDDNPMLSPLVYNRKDNMINVLCDILYKKGVVVNGEVCESECPQSAKEIYTKYTPISKVLTRMLKNSDNLYAESMFYQIALVQGKPATAAKAIAVEQEFLSKIDKDSLFGRGLGRFRIADGSGLSLYNYLSADLEVRLLQYAYQHKDIYDMLCASLPIAGIDGTLKKRMKNTSAEGSVRAKTGTLTGVSSLAGYVTAKSGNIIAFSIINQGILDADDAHAFQDRLCDELAK